MREDEAKETWREMDEQKQLAFKNGPLSNWGFEGEGLVKDAESLVKVCQASQVVALGSDTIIISMASMTARS